MKQLRGGATAEVELPIERCFSLLADVERYPSWHPELIRAVTVLDRDARGLPLRAQTKLHLAHGPLARDFDFLLEVRLEQPGLVELTRIPDGPADEEELALRWLLRGGAATALELQLEARLAVPRLVPLGPIGDTLAGSLLTAALAELQAPQAGR